MRERRLMVAVLTALATMLGGVLTAGGAGAAYGLSGGGAAGHDRVIVVDPQAPGANSRPRPTDLPDYFVERADGSRASATSVDLARAGSRTPALGRHEVLVVPVYYSARPSETPAALQETLAETDRYYNEATAGRIRFGGQVRPWTRITLSQSDVDICNEGAVEAQVRELAGDFTTDETHHIMAYMQNMPSCWWGGLATIGTGEFSSFVWINGYDVTSIWAHEFGHNLGLYHSGALYCRDPGLIPVPLSDSCDEQTYADPWDLMGNQSLGMGMVSAENLRRLGVLPAGASQMVVADTEVTLAPLTSTSGLRGLTVTDGTTSYYLEYRTPAGLDSWIDDQTYVDHDGVTRTQPGGGLVVRRDDPDFGQYGEQDVIDFHPDAFDTVYESHPGMDPGESYTLPGGRVRFAVLGATSSGARVSVTFPKAHGVFRWSGADRYAAAIAISQASFASGVKTAYIASGEVFTDALSGAAVAGRDGAPLLLTRRDRLDRPVADEITRLDPARIVVFGGPATVSDTVLKTLATWGVPVTRVSGADRYETSALISRGNYAPGAGTAYVASGLVFPDALAAAPVAGRTGGPVLLVSGDRVPDSIAAELRRLAPKRIVVLGGTSTIQPSVQTALAGFTSGAVERWDGADRYAVSALVSERAFPGGSDVVFVASGLVFPDSLAGAPVAGSTPAPLLLVRTDRIPETVAAELDRLNPRTIIVLGGTASVRGVVADALAGYIG
ncbi:MAG: cell wall-binding repeat-containing protein [Dermatophilaceae bacterium]